MVMRLAKERLVCRTYSQITSPPRSCERIRPQAFSWLQGSLTLRSPKKPTKNNTSQQTPFKSIRVLRLHAEAHQVPTEEEADLREEAIHPHHDRNSQAADCSQREHRAGRGEQRQQSLCLSDVGGGGRDKGWPYPNQLSGVIFIISNSCNPTIFWGLAKTCTWPARWVRSPSTARCSSQTCRQLTRPLPLAPA